VQPRLHAKRATNWSAPTDWETVCRRAAGRNAYNSRRRLLQEFRRFELVRAADRLRGRSLWARGAQSELAAMLGVSRSTISRDVKALLAEVNTGRPCPLCGCQVAHR
jgi:hypothetical protein